MTTPGPEVRYLPGHRWRPRPQRVEILPARIIRPSVPAIADALHQARHAIANKTCPLPPEQIDVALAGAIVTDRVTNHEGDAPA